MILKFRLSKRKFNNLLVFTLLFTAIFSLKSNAQKSKKVDSLIQIIENSNTDSLKLRALNRITSHYLYRDIDKAKHYAKRQLKFAQDISDTPGETLASHHYAIIYSNIDKYDSSKYYHNNTIKLAKLNNDLKQVSLSTHGLVILEISKGNYNEAQILNKKNLELNIKRKDTFGIALSYDVESSIYTERGQLLMALKTVLKSLKEFESLNNTVRIADAQNKLAIIENGLGNYKKSLEYSAKALKVYEETEDIDYQSQLLNVIGVSHKSKKDFDLAITNFEKSLNLSKKAGYKSVILVSFSHLVDIYLENEDFDKAKSLIDEGLKIAHEINYNYMINYFNFRLATYYKKTSNYEAALKLLSDEIHSENKEERDAFMSSVYKLRSEVYKLQKNYKNAFVDLETHGKLKDSIFNKTKASKIEELRIVHDTEQKEKEIALQQKDIQLFQQKEKVSESRQLLMGIGLISLLILSVSIFYGLQQKMKRNKVEREKLDNSLQFKEKELTTHALHLAHKNEVLLDLKSQLKELKSGNPNARSYQKVINTINLDINNDSNWEQFRNYFEDVHKDFNSKVMRNYPEVSNNDLRLMSLLKMNLSSKEIANILNISTEGVKKARYRLRKKLNLSTEESLQELVIDM
ncbi:tetratricopeptide repeat protein [Winogradskyella sp. PE311]|uniref:tetratricopeptide repeat protein n=1 Tax=Winogradskyella sp. PE311 TaxID=3366943 RepID=UPI00397FD083